MEDPKLDPNQIWRRVYDHVSQALKVKLKNTQINMELNHKDGDSVTAHPAKHLVSAIGVTDEDVVIIPPQDISSLSVCQIFLKVQEGSEQGAIEVQISPVDSGDVWFHLADMEVKSGKTGVLPFLARRMRIIKKRNLGDCEFDIHFVGRA